MFLRTQKRKEWQCKEQFCFPFLILDILIRKMRISCHFWGKNLARFGFFNFQKQKRKRNFSQNLLIFVCEKQMILSTLIRVTPIICSHEGCWLSLYFQAIQHANYTWLKHLQYCKAVFYYRMLVYVYVECL